jgi:hypothetical protein
MRKKVCESDKAFLEIVAQFAKITQIVDYRLELCENAMSIVSVSVVL